MEILPLSVYLLPSSTLYPNSYLSLSLLYGRSFRYVYRVTIRTELTRTESLDS